MSNGEPQSARTVVMVRPVKFQANDETLETNRFQHLYESIPPAEAQPRARREFAAVVEALRSADINVIVFEDTPSPHTPDSIYPNNWFSTHVDGTVVLYPIMVPNRRQERRRDIVQSLADDYGYRILNVLDLTGEEAEDRYLESTGSMVLDRINRIAYASLSARTDVRALELFGRRMNYETVPFDTRGLNGDPVYHTNVMMCVGERFAVLGGEVFTDTAQRDAIVSRLAATGHETILLSNRQLEQFAGNMLELRRPDGSKVVAMSQRACDALEAEQKAVLERHATIVAVPIPTIEDCGGGSIRCMLADMHLPKASA